MSVFKIPTKNWYIERIVFLMAGTFVIASLILAHFISPYFLVLAAFVGLMQIVFALTGYCPMAILLHLFGIQEK